MTFCALPSRPATGLADSRIKAASQRLADALESSNEYQAYLCAAQAVAQDPQVSRLVATIRERRGGYSQDGAGDLQSQLETLPVMLALPLGIVSTAFQAPVPARRFRPLPLEISRALGLESGSLSSNSTPGPKEPSRPHRLPRAAG